MKVNGLKRLCLVFFLLLAVVGSAQAAPRYYYRNLGSLPAIPGDPWTNYDPYAVNLSGQTVGVATTSLGVSHGFLKPLNSPMVDLGNNFGGGNSFAYGLNDTGQIVGEADDGAGNFLAFLKDPGTDMVSLGTLGGAQSWAAAINQASSVTGASFLTGDLVLRAFLKVTGQNMVDLGSLNVDGSSWANAINDSGQVVGASDDAGLTGATKAFLKNTNPDQPMVDLGVVSGATNSEAFGINNSGQVVGVVGIPTADPAIFTRKAFFKSTNPDQPMADLGTLGGDESSAFGINNAGQVVGWALDANVTQLATLWQGGAIYDLNKITVNLPKGTTLAFASAINNKGWIVGQDASGQAFLLVPEIPIPGVLKILLLP